MPRPNKVYKNRIDTLTTEAYKLENVYLWANYGPEYDVPMNTAESDNSFIIYEE